MSIRGKYSLLIAVAVSLLLVFATHITYIANGFVWLDHGDIENARAILVNKPIGVALFQRFGDTHFYRPLVTIINTLDYRLYGDYAVGYHLTNVLLHVLATATAMMFARVYFKLRSNTAILAGLIFGIHPLSWLPTSAISYRPEVLLTIFTLLALIGYIKARTSALSGYSTLSAVAFLLALLSKESALILVPLLILSWELMYKRNNFYTLFGNKYLLTVELVTIATYIILRTTTLKNIWRFNYPDMTISEAIGTRLHALVQMIWWIISPVKPPLSDATQIVSLAHPLSMAYILIGTAIFFAVLHMRIRAYYQVLSIATFIAITLLPGLNLIPLPRFVSPHYAYLAAVGGAVGITYVFAKFSTAKSIYARTVSIFLLVIWIAVASYTTYNSGKLFMNDFTLFTPEVLHDPKFKEGTYYLAMHQLNRGDHESAEALFQQALEKDNNIIAFVDETALNINYSSIFAQRGDFARAQELLLTAGATASPIQQQTVVYNLAAIAFQTGNFEHVVEIFETYNTHLILSESVRLWADALDKLGRKEDSVGLLQKYNLE